MTTITTDNTTKLNISVTSKAYEFILTHLPSPAVVRLDVKLTEDGTTTELFDITSEEYDKEQDIAIGAYGHLGLCIVIDKQKITLLNNTVIDIKEQEDPDKPLFIFYKK